jgi:hypothetical protein
MAEISDEDLTAAHRVLVAVLRAMETYRAELAQN